ncbi:MAG: hypothetical protein BWX99_01750 [Deltaproteobacteria bacterium ADurb.Bin151]|nr:MAG: hypothetical protein BWX99_01750 [Deltaproteobacteria bacterium ADurb.Bin151]
MDILESRNRHDTEKKIQLHQVMTLVRTGFLQLVRHMQVSIDDLEIIRQRQILPDLRTGLLAFAGAKLFNFHHQPAET